MAGCAAALAGCGQRAGTLRSEHSTQQAKRAGLDLAAISTAAVPRCRPGLRRLGSSRFAYAALVRRSVTVYRLPRFGRALHRFARLDVNGYPTVFGVLSESTGRACKAAWYQVELPTTPNGATGWIPASSVRLFRVEARIVVDLSRRQLIAYRAGQRVLQTSVSIGAPATPTPVGRYYVNERFVLTTSDGPFGPAALGISAHSDALRDWVQGGPIGIHGTDAPELIGQAASHGCVRLPNGTMRRLFALAPAGTPVLIRA
jgi:lipoprotein-anchoring transpeptidase ErfK/SrfK